MKFIYVPGFMIDPNEIVWMSKNSENSGDGWTVVTEDGNIIKIDKGTGVELFDKIKEWDEAKGYLA